MKEWTRQLADARAGTWLGEGSSAVQQAALRDMQQAFQNWWGGTHGRPTWRRKYLNESFCVRDVKVEKLSRKWATVLVPKLGTVKFRLSRPMPVEYGMGHVTLDRAGRWHISFSAPQAPVDRTDTGSVVGIDRGVKLTLTTSDGVTFNVPTPPKDERVRRARLQRKVSRQKKGSNRREATRLAIAKLTTRQADRRKDWVEKTSTTLVRGHNVIVFEDLKVRNMMRSAKGTIENPGRNVRQKAGLNRSIAEAAWSMLERRTTEKALASNVTVVKIPAPGTSQTCSACGYRDADNRRSQAWFACCECGHQQNADINTAKVIRAAGLAVLARGGVGKSSEPMNRELPGKRGRRAA